MNYVCNCVSGRIRWEVWCLSSLTETGCSDSYTELGEIILAREKDLIIAGTCILMLLCIINLKSPT